MTYRKLSFSVFQVLIEEWTPDDGNAPSAMFLQFKEFSLLIHIPLACRDINISVMNWIWGCRNFRLLSVGEPCGFDCRVFILFLYSVTRAWMEVVCPAANTKR
jgi:hypothetical protein